MRDVYGHHRTPGLESLTMRTPRFLLVAIALLTVVFPASAALSPQYEEWRTGPIQWIMTGPEKNAWKKLASDQAASDFIDLFWARRDPSAGTPQNEARDEWDSRVKYADERFKEPRKRGSLTDRGRAWTVLGPPPGMTDVHGRITNTVDSHRAGSASTSSTGRGQSDETTGRMDPSGGRQLGARDVWIWEHDAAVAKFDLPRVEIVFVTDPVTGRTIRDIFRRDWGAAEAAVLKSQIKGDYKELPSWAAFGGLTPKMQVVTIADAPPAAPKPAVSQPAATPTVAAPAAATGPMAPRGATRLTLTRNVFAINTQSGKDPFAGVQTSDKFKTTEDLGWVAQYCSQTDQAPSVPFIVRITGGPTSVDLATPPEEVVPDQIKASPGCYLLRGAIPLDSMQPGAYKLHVLIDDPIVTTENYELASPFTIE